MAHIGKMAKKHPERPRDPNQLAKLVIDIATGAANEPDKQTAITPAQEFARSGGLKGGLARAASLSPEQRRTIAKRAAKKRWGDKKKP